MLNANLAMTSNDDDEATEDFNDEFRFLVRIGKDGSKCLGCIFQ